MALTYRLAKEDDIPSISMVFAEAKDDLDRRRGFFESPTNPLPPSPSYAFLMRKTPCAFWVAEKDGEVVGFSDSFMRGSFWYFAYLFIKPGHQGQNIGKNLLEKTLSSWEAQRITNRATITFAFNPASQFLYMQYGMYPREPGYYAYAPSKVIKENMEQTIGLDYEQIMNLGDASDATRRIDEHVLGFSLEWHHEYFFETHAKCYVFKDKGSPVGYAYVRPNGVVGPSAVMSNEFTKPVLNTALALSVEQGVENAGYWMPGSNIHAVDLSLKHKMRIYPMVFMSTKAFAKWENYIFHSAALM
jgi:ribosomal protein S18 acetylase RimI-like enzyme